MRKIISLSALFILLVHVLHGQRVFTTTNGSGIIDKYSIDWVMGEMSGIQTRLGNGFILTEGMLQPSYTGLIAVPSSIEQVVRLYPNTGAGLFYVEMDNLEYVDKEAKLVNMVSGKEYPVVIVHHQPGIISFDCTEVPSGPYLLMSLDPDSKFYGRLVKF